MGPIACHSENYNEIINKHKDEIRRYIIEKRGKEFLDRQISKSRKLIAELTNRYENQNILLISNKLSQLKQFYDRVAKEVDRWQLGGITALQQMKGQPLESILGFKFIQNLFEQLATNVKNAFKEEELVIIGQLTQLKQKYETEHQSQFTNHIMQNNIPASEKQIIEERISMEFHSEISEFQGILFDQFRQNLNNDVYERRLKSIDCSTHLQTLESVSKQKLVIGMNLLLGEKIDSFIIIQ